MTQMYNKKMSIKKKEGGLQYQHRLNIRRILIGKMAVKSDLIESSRASLGCVSAACNPETWRRHIALSPDLWDSIFNMDSRPRCRRATVRSRNDLQRWSVFQTRLASYDSERTTGSTCEKYTILYYIERYDPYVSSRRDPANFQSAYIAVDVPSERFFYFTMSSRLPCDLRMAIAVTVNNK